MPTHIHSSRHLNLGGAVGRGLVVKLGVRGGVVLIGASVSEGGDGLLWGGWWEWRFVGEWKPDTSWRGVGVRSWSYEPNEQINTT